MKDSPVVGLILTIVNENGTMSKAIFDSSEETMLEGLEYNPLLGLSDKNQQEMKIKKDVDRMLRKSHERTSVSFLSDDCFMDMFGEGRRLINLSRGSHQLVQVNSALLGSPLPDYVNPIRMTIDDEIAELNVLETGSLELPRVVSGIQCSLKKDSEVDPQMIGELECEDEDD